MKLFKFLSCIAITVILLLIFSVSACCESITDEEYYEKIISELTDSLSDETTEILEDFGFSEFSIEEIENISAHNIFNAIINVFSGSIREPVEFLCIVTGIMILCSISSGVSLRDNDYFSTISVYITAFLILSEIILCIKDAVTAISSVGVLMKMIIPAIAILSAFSGTPSLAVSSYSIAIYLSEIISALCRDFLTPLLCVISAAGVCISINPVINFSSLLNMAKKLFSVSLGFLGTLFAAVMSIKNIVSVQTDKLAVKGVKFIIGSSVPVVGNVLSEGLSTAIAAASLFRNAYGIFGIIVVIIIILPSLSQLFMWNISLLLGEMVAGALSENRVCDVFSSVRFVISMLSTIILFTSFILLMSVATLLVLSGRE